ncbi:PREDICTED: non-specific lipid-transfer protein-like protein At5g64080 [Tarenaya hassleriana]|uniref:non-specific lipid-transfer protein-like protein At5g64080 n=1 Tax=Tarenaya hassleriana TaxID=28532 RepID=UPI00053C8371|nr:PREDICTED: non-specific lipid-transfer protein-like protein At5g64080 [Tarenaya hassleriana]
MDIKIIPFLTLIFLSILYFPVSAQISTPCSPTMLSTVTPCLNFLTGSSGIGTSPTADCCGALRTLTGIGMDCLCLIVTASVPFSVPVNRTVAISLPRACSMPGVPVKCNASAAPLPAPGPAALGPKISPTPPEGKFRYNTKKSYHLFFFLSLHGGSRTALTPPSAASPPPLNPMKLSLLLFALGFGVLKCF